MGIDFSELEKSGAKIPPEIKQAAAKAKATKASQAGAEVDKLAYQVIGCLASASSNAVRKRALEKALRLLKAR
jgi:hypothetical protein